MINIRLTGSSCPFVSLFDIMLIFNFFLNTLHITTISITHNIHVSSDSKKGLIAPYPAKSNIGTNGLTAYLENIIAKREIIYITTLYFLIFFSPLCVPFFIILSTIFSVLKTLIGVSHFFVHMIRMFISPKMHSYLPVCEVLNVRLNNTGNTSALL